MIKLLAISVGTPQEIDMNGKKVVTSILKNPVLGPVYIRKEGPEGDKPAVHPDAVYAITDAHYDYWAKELGADRKTWSWGHFGENLTLSGIDETKIRIGDIFKIGKEVKLQAVCNRIPCSKLAWRMGQSDLFLRNFSISGKTGFYLKVLQEGYIHAEDLVEHIQADETAMTIHDLSRFFVSIDEAKEEDLCYVLSHEHLGISGVSKIKKKLALIKDLNLVKAGRWKGWREFVIDQIICESEDVKSFLLRPKDGKILGGCRPGQFLTCKLAQGALIRTWTISDYIEAQGCYRISIKKIDGGKASTYMHSASIGEVIEVKPPNGSFVLDRSTDKPIVLISAGIGITPMLAMLKGHLERDLKPYSHLYFIHAAKNGNFHPFKGETLKLSASKNVKFLQYYSRPLDSDQDYVKGRFDIKDLDHLMEGNLYHWGNRWHEWPKQEALFYICGPLPFQEHVQKALKEWGVKEAHVFVESFTPLLGEPVGVKAESARVIFAKSGIEADWSEEEDLTLLELAEKCGIESPNACRMGVCETCECVLKKGSVYYEHGGSLTEKVLICCAKPGSEEVILDL